jgi:transcriptional regulator with XRE-family HTH domain
MLTMADRRPQEERRQAFGRALDQALGARGVTQRQLAEALNTVQAAISAWVNAEAAPDPDVVFEAERFLKLDPGHLSHHLGYLPPEAAKKGTKPTFESVVLDDELLDETSKRGLLAAYREFVTSRRRRRR